MGSVYEAHDDSLDRRVALKTILRSQRPAPDALERFRREALAAARLDHPNIVAVYDIGEHDGFGFFTMALVAGASLERTVRGSGPLPPLEAVGLMIPVVEAVGYAHRQQVVHRDLKPDNVMVDADGRPRVMDFGLARHLLQASELTGTNQILGTPRYMAPEQARNRSVEIGPATDVYALGGILGFLLSGKPPMPGETLTEILINLLESPPSLPRDTDDRIPQALDDICRRCLQKRPQDRYPSTTELLAVLRGFARGESASTSAPDLPTPVPRRSGVGRKWAAGLGAVALLAVVVGLAVSDNGVEKKGENPSAPTVTERTAPEVVGGDKPPLKTDPAEPSVVSPLFVTPPLFDAPKLLDGPPKDARPVEPKKSTARPEEFVMKGEPGTAHTLFLPDGKTLVTWTTEGALQRWDVATGKPLALLVREPRSIKSVRVGPGNVIAVATNDRKTTIFEEDGKARLLMESKSAQPTALAFSPDGTRIAVGQSDGTLNVLEVRTGRVLFECIGHGKTVLDEALAFAPDGALLVSGSDDHSLRVWDAETGKNRATQIDLGEIRSFRFSGDGKSMFYLDAYFLVHLQKRIDLATGKLTASAKVPFYAQTSSSLEFVLGGERILTVSNGGQTFIWNGVDKEAVAVSEGIPSAAFVVLPSRDIVLAVKEFQLVVYRLSSDKDSIRIEKIRACQEHGGYVSGLAVSADGRIAATADQKGWIRIRDVEKLISKE